LKGGFVLQRIPSPEGAVLRFFRFSRGMKEIEFARIAGVDVSTLRRWELGLLPLSRDRLVELLGKHLRVPAEAVDEALSAHRTATQPPEPEGPSALSDPERRLLRRAATAGARSGAETVYHELALERLRRRAARHTAWAAEQWSWLKKLPQALQTQEIRAHQGGQRSWALAVRLCEASATAAAHSAAEALRLARAGVSLAREAPGSPRWRLRLAGHCEPFLGNAFRVSGDFPSAREAFARADEAWAQGEGGDPATLLDGTRRLDLKASFLQHDGRIDEALALIEQALQGVRSDQARVKLLSKKANSLEIAGEYEVAIETLRQAESLLEARSEERLPCVIAFNTTVNYCHLDRYQDAENLLLRVEAMAQDLRTDLDAFRVLWLRGRIRAGLGYRQEALGALSQVRQHLEAEQIAYDYAVVSLELATLHLEQGRTGLVKALAAEMLWIFEGQKVHQEALAALALFRKAAEKEEARADWTRRLVKYLYRAQYNPELRFEA
jgi:tetratricopeptide (TPR) repeat protein